MKSWPIQRTLALTQRAGWSANGGKSERFANSAGKSFCVHPKNSCFAWSDAENTQQSPLHSDRPAPSQDPRGASQQVTSNWAGGSGLLDPQGHAAQLEESI